MASLLGKADSTLAQMSYKEAMADVAPDLRGIYKEEALTQAVFQKGIEDHFNKLHADSNALADELKEATATAMADLSAGMTPDDAGMEMYNSYLNGLKDRMKGVPKGKKGDFERSKIRAELSRLKNSTDGISQTLVDLGTKITNEDFINDGAFKKNGPLLLAISKNEAKREIVNGNLIYSIPNPLGGEDIKMNHQELRESLTSNDPEVNKNFNNATVSANALGKEKGTVWGNERQGIVNKYEKSFSTQKGFSQNIWQKQEGLPYSFAELMGGKGDGALNMQIWDALKQMGYNVPEDKNDDGKITEKDFANEENGIALINSLTDITDGNFNFQAAKQVAAGFYADNIGQKEFTDGTKTRKTFKPNVGKNPFGTKNIEFAPEEGGQKLYKTPTKAWADRDAILSGQPFQGIYGDYSVGKDGGYMLNGEPISQYDALIQEKVNLMGDRADRLGGSNIGGGFAEAKDLSPYFGPNANEENAVSKLKEMYPNLKISSPVGMREKIKVNEELFYLRGKGKSTPEMEMIRLQEHIASIDPLNPNN